MYLKVFSTQCTVATTITTIYQIPSLSFIDFNKDERQFLHIGICDSLLQKEEENASYTYDADSATHKMLRKIFPSYIKW